MAQEVRGAEAEAEAEMALGRSRAQEDGRRKGGHEIGVGSGSGLLTTATKDGAQVGARSAAGLLARMLADVKITTPDHRVRPHRGTGEAALPPSTLLTAKLRRAKGTLLCTIIFVFPSPSLAFLNFHLSSSGL